MTLSYYCEFIYQKIKALAFLEVVLFPFPDIYKSLGYNFFIFAS
jgi:hypothetical protein